MLKLIAFAILACALHSASAGGDTYDPRRRPFSRPKTTQPTASMPGSYTLATALPSGR